MNIGPIRLNLRHIVLLAKEYNEKISSGEHAEAKKIEDKILDKKSDEVSVYDRRFLNTVLNVKESILNQINYFASKLLMEFVVDDQEFIDIDQKKVDFARQKLTPEEMDVFGSLYELRVIQQIIERERNGHEMDVTVIEPELDSFISKAAKLAN